MWEIETANHVFILIKTQTVKPEYADILNVVSTKLNVVNGM